MTLTAERLRELLYYDPETGVFARNGRVAGCARADGYRVVSVDDKLRYAQRLAWLYMLGNEADGDIDHINGDPSDNRWCNLRCVTRSQNLANARKPKTNTSGFKGVSWSTVAGKWSVQIRVRNKRFCLGHYDDIQEAHQAYVAAAREHNGVYARVT